MKLPTRHTWAMIGAALPDGVSAFAFLVVWIAPFAFGPHAVKNAMLVMMVEFFVIHASGMIGATVLREDIARGKRVATVLGFGAFYLLFVSVWSLVFQVWWPFVAFGWLLVGKLVLALDLSRTSAERRAAMQTRWGMSILVFVLGAFATTILPLPRLGIGVDLVSRLGLPGTGLWVEQPHRVVAFGFFYFTTLAWLNVRALRVPKTVSKPASK